MALRDPEVMGALLRRDCEVREWQPDPDYHTLPSLRKLPAIKNPDRSCWRTSNRSDGAVGKSLVNGAARP